MKETFLFIALRKYVLLTVLFKAVLLVESVLIYTTEEFVCFFERANLWSYRLVAVKNSFYI